MSILYNTSSLAAENELNITQASLQNTLSQLSSGSRLNSGADDAAGLSIANGLEANITALTQSTQNATDGVGKLQVADGALSQVTSLLNRAVTLATEAANGTETTSQQTALNNEFTSIKNEIDNIGSQTTYNGSAVFAGNTTNYGQTVLSGTGNGLATAVASGTLSLTWGTAQGESFTSSASDKTVGDLINDINQNSNGALVASLNSQGALMVTATDGTAVSTATAVTVTAGSTLKLGSDAAAETGSNPTNSSAFDVYLSDATSAGSGTISVALNQLSSDNINGVSLGSNDLTSSADAQAALATINNAIAQVAALRGNVGAGINQLNAAVDVENVQVQNLTSAESNITSADISSDVSKMSQYDVLEQTGISALSQSNQMQQLVLKLLQ
jgi:flagellin